MSDASPPPAAAPVAGKSEGARLASMADAAAETAPPFLVKYLKMAAPAIAAAADFVQLALPHIIKAFNASREFYQSLPADLVEVGIGLIFCFFGGLYPTLFAAIQAARLCGWETTQKAILDICSEAAIVMAENKKDDDRDDDGDGIKDVNQIDSKALMLRKTQLVLTKCDPAKINTAVAGLYMTWIGVLATLKVQFARTITLALSISEFLHKPVNALLRPALDRVVPPQYAKWVPVCLGWLCKGIAMSVAWYVQRVQSAFSSAIRGGLLTSRALLKYAHSKGYTANGMLPKNHEDTYLDEAAGWTLAVLGFYFQYCVGFSTPFPLNLALFPLTLSEWYIEWTVTGDI